MRTLDALPRAIQKRALTTSMRKAAKQLLSFSKNMAPRKSGLLVSKMRVRVMKKKSRGEVAFVVKTGNRSEMGISGDAKGYYPAIQEYGNKKRGIKGFHFMKLAMEHYEPRYIQTLAQGLRNFLATYRPKQ